MPVHEWLGASWGDLAMVLASTVGIYLSLIIYTRMAGLRSFSKMSSFDFGITVAFGSLLASVSVSPTATLAQGVLGMGTLFALQAAVGALRRRSLVQRTVDNQPRLLMVGDRMLHDAMRASRITDGDVRAKLREANVLDWQQIRAVVLESTGDISVLHADLDGPALNPELLADVIGGDRLAR